MGHISGTEPESRSGESGFEVSDGDFPILLSVASALRARRQTDRAPVRCLIEPSRLGPPGTRIADGISGSSLINDASDRLGTCKMGQMCGTGPASLRRRIGV